jgi:hypothetical protein
MQDAGGTIFVPPSSQQTARPAIHIPGLNQPTSTWLGDIRCGHEGSARTDEVRQYLDHTHDVKTQIILKGLQRANSHVQSQFARSIGGHPCVRFNPHSLPAKIAEALQQETSCTTHIQQAACLDEPPEDSGITPPTLAEQLCLSEVVRVTCAASEKIRVAVHLRNMVRTWRDFGKLMAARRAATDPVSFNGPQPLRRTVANGAFCTLHPYDPFATSAVIIAPASRGLLIIKSANQLPRAHTAIVGTAFADTLAIFQSTEGPAL